MFKKGLLSVICSLMIMLMIPFSISANASLSAPFIGYNIYNYDYDTDTYITSYDVDLDSSGFKMTCTNMLSSGGCNTYSQTSNEDISGTLSLNGSTGVHTNRILKIDLILDNYYVGYVRLTHSGTTKNYYVNGNKIEIFTTGTGQTITVNSYELNLNNSNSWAFPIESYTIISQQLSRNTPMVDLFSGFTYIFPIFQSSSNLNIGEAWSNTEGLIFYYVLGFSQNVNIGNYTNYFTVENGTVETIEELYYASNMTIKKWYIRSTTSNGFVTLKTKGSYKYMPIFFNNERKIPFMSTDFALNYGFTNRMMENIEKIANGSNESNESASSLDDSTSDLTQDIGQYTQIENNFNDDMNSYLNDIDTTTTLPSAMGSKFLTSANWVRVQFNRMTDNTPFGSILGFSLVLGLALLIIGKVYK